MIWFANNLINRSDAVLSASSVSSLMSISNLQETQLCKFNRIPSGDQYIQVDFADPQSIDSVIIGGVNPYEFGGINFDSAVVQLSNDNFATAPHAEIELSRADREIHLFNILSDTLSAKSFRIRTSGSGMKDIGTIYLGMKSKMPGMDTDQDLGLNFTHPVKESDSGVSFGSTDTGCTYMTIKGTFPRFNKTYMHTLMDILYDIRNVQPIFVKVWNKGNEIRMMYMRQTSDACQFPRSDSRQRPFKHGYSFKEVF